MPLLRNAGHEIFAEAVASGTPKAEADEIVGYQPDRHHAARLATMATFSKRVAEIQAAAVEAMDRYQSHL